MARRGLLAKVSEKAAVQDQLRREKDCIGPEKFATDHQLLVEACEQGDKSKAKSAPRASELDKLRPPNSLFYKLYPQSEKDDATEKARKYWAKLRGEEEGDDAGAGLPSDEAMSGAFTALKFMQGEAGGAVGSGAVPAPAPPAPELGGGAGDGGEDADSLKRKLLEALGGEPAPAPSLREGGIVEAFGLKGAPELNGRRGTLQGLDAASGRWQVDLEGAGPKKLKPENLRPVEAAAASPEVASPKRPRSGDAATAPAAAAGDETTFL